MLSGLSLRQLCGLWQRGLTRSVGLGYGHVHDPADVLRLGRGSSEAADAWFGRCAGGQAVGVVVGACCHLLWGSVRDEALGDGEFGVAQLLLHLGVLVGSGELLIGGGRALRWHHAAPRSVWTRAGVSGGISVRVSGRIVGMLLC